MADIPIIPGISVATKGILNKPLKDIICALLFGGLDNMLKGPLLCVNADLDKLLTDNFPGVPSIADLKNELKDLKDQITAFEQHSGIKDMLGRVNGAIAEVQSLLALDGMCKIPLKAPLIPDIMKQIIDAEFANANAILNDLGRLTKPQLCLNGDGGIGTGSYNPESILGQLQGHIKRGADIPGQQLDILKNRLSGVSTALKASINRELFPDFRHKHNLLTGAPYAGEAAVVTLAAAPALANQWNPPYPPGTAPNFKDTMNTAQSLVANVKQTGSYPADVNGIRSMNIWPGLLGPGLYGLAVNALTPQDPLFAQQEPVYDYCGKLVGYTSTIITGSADDVGGNPLVDVDPNPPKTTFDLIWIAERKCWAVTGVQSEQVINGRKDMYLDANPTIELHRSYNHILSIPSIDSMGNDLAPEFYIYKVKEDLTPDVGNRFNLGLSRLETYELLEDANGLDGDAGIQRRTSFPTGTTMYFAAGKQIYSSPTEPAFPNADVWWYNTNTAEIKKYIPGSDTSGGGGGGGDGDGDGGSHDVWYFNGTDCIFSPGGFVPGPVETYATQEACLAANPPFVAQLAVETEPMLLSETLATGWVAITEQDQIDNWIGSTSIYNASNTNYLCYSNQDGSVFGLIKLV